MSTDTMKLVSVSLTYDYKKYSYPLFAYIYL